MFRLTPSRGGRGRRADVDSWCILSVAAFCVFFSSSFFERTPRVASIKPPCLIYVSTSNEARPREMPHFHYKAKKTQYDFHAGVCTGLHV